VQQNQHAVQPYEPRNVGKRPGKPRPFWNANAARESFERQRVRVKRAAEKGMPNNAAKRNRGPTVQPGMQVAGGV